jgi:predicted metal-binding membrane protein
VRARTTALAEAISHSARSFLGHGRKVATQTLAIGVIGWAFLAWIALDMGHPVAQLMMPGSWDWSAANMLMIGCMWAVMMAATMLPSVLPMILTFDVLCRRAAVCAARCVPICGWRHVLRRRAAVAGTLGPW